MSKPTFNKKTQQNLLHSAIISSLVAAAPAIADEAQSKNINKDDIEHIQVIGRKANKLKIKDQTATKMDVELKDVGRSVTVLDALELDKRAIQDVREAFNYVAGFRGNGPADRTYSARGIRTSIDTVMVDGLRSLQGGEGGTGSKLPTTFNAESVVFLRGPEALLYGSGVGGGIINIITKKPSAAAETSLSISNRSYVSDDTGNFKRNKTSFDLDTTGAVAGNSDYLYRLLAKYTPSGDHFQKNREIDETLLDLAFTWNASDSTSITPRIEYGKREQTGGSSYADGVFTENFFNGKLKGDGEKEYGKPLNRGEYYGGKDDKGDNLSKSFSLKLDHDINEDWSLTGQYRYNKTESEARDLYISDSSYTINKGKPDETKIPLNVIGRDKINRKWVISKGNDSYKLVDLSLQGITTLAGMEHHVLFGANYRDMEVNFLRDFQDSKEADGKNWILASDPSQQVVGPIPTKFATAKSSPRNQKDLNVYFKDRIKITSSTTLVAGVAYVEQKQHEEKFNKKTNSFDIFNKKYDSFLWDLGVVQSLNDNINVFTTLSRAYQPVSARWIKQYGKGKTDYKAVEGMNYEIGAKGDFFNGDLTTAVTLYKQTRENSTKFVNRTLLQLEGKSFESKGVEFDLDYKANEFYNTSLSYAFTRANDTVGDKKGLQTNNAPKHSISLWNNFQPTEELSFGLGLRYESERSDGSYILPSYFEMDMAAYYKVQNWNLSLVLNNALDKNRAEAGANWVTVQPNAPRSLNMKVKYTF
ncbi:MAG: TonB-dependent siderophore receptor [Parashewanella sp.]